MVQIRHERAEDEAQVHHVNSRAFGRDLEADIADSLRRNGRVTLSLVAVEAEQIVGHIMFTPVTVTSDGETFEDVALGPVGVLPERQNLGIGSALIRAGLEEIANAGFERVFVLGHPGFYPRFGFVPSSRFGIRSEFDVSENAFMALELREGALSECIGTVTYPPEFREV